MAFTAADLGFPDILMGLPAIGIDLDLERKERKRSFEFRPELHIFTGISPENTRNRTVGAVAGLPGQRWYGCLEQAAFFPVLPTKIIPKEIRAFHTGGIFHTLVMYIPDRVSIRMVSPTSTKLGTNTSNPVFVVTAFVTLVAVSPRTDGSAWTTT